MARSKTHIHGKVHLYDFVTVPGRLIRKVDAI